MRSALAIAASAVLLAGCGSSGATGSAPGGAGPESAAPTPAATKKALAGSPAALAALHAQGSRLLDGGEDGFKGRLAKLKGHPVVVNKWASWCGPCRAEFPFLQKESIKSGRKVAFVGVNSNDSDGDANSFLGRFPLSYPSYKDPDLKVAAVFNGVQGFPTTAFYDSKGKLAYVHQGAYATEAKLAADIERYAAN
jgi:cytochrome c biogenesis protein CcmG/thiol:disulfide interchange protein DsbE